MHRTNYTDVHYNHKNSYSLGNLVIIIALEGIISSWVSTNYPGLRMTIVDKVSC